ncbi:hypothetical protein [Vibrio astriarenae]|uniref:hypothetical protein n=1 Tax=Vibrio astriarenae TaxID=1481923 RepID=UPI00373615C0
MRLMILILTLFSTHALAAWQAHWLVDDVDFQERQRHTIYLQLLNDEAIAGVIHLEMVTAKGLFIEQTSNFWQYGSFQQGNQTLAQAVLRFDIYPSSDGDFTLPSATIQVGRGENAFTINSQPKTFSVAKLPNESRGKIVSSKVALSQTATDVDITAGGVVTRSIKLEVNDLPGHFINDLPPLTQIEHVELRTGNSTTNTVTNRSELSGSRTTDYHYRFEQQGNYTLPPVHLEWWDSNTQQVKALDLKAIEVTVAPAPPLPLSQRLENMMLESKQWLEDNKWLLFFGVLITGAIVNCRAALVLHFKLLRNRVSKLTTHEDYQAIKTAILVATSPQPTAKKHLYRWLSHQRVYDVLTHNYVSTKRDGVNIERVQTCKLILLQVQKRWFARYRLKPLNHD